MPAYGIMLFPTATATQSSRGEGSSKEERRNPLRQWEKPGQMCARSPSEPSRHCSVVTHHPSGPQVLLSSLLLKPTPQGPSKVSAHWFRAHLLCSCPTLGICPLHVHKPLANAAKRILPGASMGHHRAIAFFCQSHTRGPEARGYFQTWNTGRRHPKPAWREDSAGRHKRWMCWELLLGRSPGHVVSFCGWVWPCLGQLRAHSVQHCWSPKAPGVW